MLYRLVLKAVGIGGTRGGAKTPRENASHKYEKYEYS